MERLHGVPQSDGRPPRVIGLPALVPPESSTRSVADCRRLRQGAPLGREEDSPMEEVPFPFDGDYQETTNFPPDAMAHLECDFGPGDLAWADPGRATPFPDDFLEDPDITRECQTEQVMALDRALVLESGESATALFTSVPPPLLARETLKFLALGLVVHLAAFSLFVAVPTPSVPGFGGISDKPILVRLTEAREIDTPDAPSPAAADSPASSASLARRDLEPEKKARKKFENKAQTDLEAKEDSSQPLIESPPIEPKSSDRSGVAPQKDLANHSLEQGPSNDSKNVQDSTASTPSVASPERTGALKDGDEVQTYKDRILLAIHEAAYYPRAALRSKAHGQTVVRFTLNKDGSLVNLSVAHHGHSKTLDEAALKIVEKASSQFPPIPASLMKDQVSYVVPIVFKKRR